MARADCPAHTDRQDLVVATPGVATARLCEELDSLPQRELVVERATRCGSIAADTAVPARLRIAVVPCAVSLHAADRLRRQVRSARQSIDSVILCRDAHESSLRVARRTLAARFDCPVTVGVAADRRHRCPSV